MSAKTLSNLELIKSFCNIDVSYTYYSILEPYYCKGYACATDGKIIAAFHSEPFDNRDRRVPNGAHVLESTEPRGDWQQMPAVARCKSCDGAGQLVIHVCAACEGSGEVAHDCNCDLCIQSHEECPQCCGSGEHKNGVERTGVCEDCSRDYVSLFGKKFSIRYLRKIADLPNAEICDSSKEYALLFRSGEILGVLMGMK